MSASQTLTQPESAHAGGVGRLRALAAFCERRQRERLGARLAYLYAIGLAVTYGLLVLLAGDAESASGARSFVLAEVRAASIVPIGLYALTLAANWAELDRGEGVFSLLRQRGFQPHALGLAHVWAGARRLTLLLAVPAVALCALAAARVHLPRPALGLALLALALTLYSVLLAASISALAAAARLLAPRNGRLLLLSLVLVPHAARELWPSMPSVPALFGSLLATISRLGSG